MNVNEFPVYKLLNLTNQYSKILNGVKENFLARRQLIS